MRSLTADRRVVDAVGLTPAQLALWKSRYPEGTPMREAKLDDGADGTKVLREEWYFPGEGILPPPMSAEARERVERKRRERAEKDPEWLERTREGLIGRGMSFG